MTDKPTYDELEARCQRFATMLASAARTINDGLAQAVRDQKADAWDGGFEAGQKCSRGRLPKRKIHIANPYREDQK